MRVSYTEVFKKRLARHEKKFDRQVRGRIKELVKNLQSGRSTKGMRLHKVNLKDGEYWSASLGLKTRLIFVYVKDGILLVNIGSHDEVYG